MTKCALVIDDDPITLKILENTLSVVGFKSTLATCGRDALLSLSQDTYDLIISDIVMPDLDGRELMHLIRLKEPYQEVPYLIISGALTHEETNQLLSSLKANTRFMAKPIDKKILMEHLKVFDLL